MGVLTIENEMALAITPTRFIKGYILNADDITRKLIPHAIRSIEVLEGDGHTVGTIRLVHFGTNTNIAKYSKQRFDVIDVENGIFEYTVLEGEDFDKFADSVSRRVKVETSPNNEEEEEEGTVVLKIKTRFYTKGEYGDENDGIIKEMHIQFMDEVQELLKAVVAYLNAHPHEYN